MAEKNNPKKVKRISKKLYPKIDLKDEREIAMDFAVKVVKRFDKLVKSVILFGSAVKQTSTVGSDIDIIVVIDDASINWDLELIAWYREELGKIIQNNSYKKDLHINTVKLTTWWEDIRKGDPVIVNILRFGEPLIDSGGFFEPLKMLLQQGKIRSTPEAIYTCLKRAPEHLGRSYAAELNTIEGIYWCLVDSAHAALMAANKLPPSPEHVPESLRQIFVEPKIFSEDFVKLYEEVFTLHKRILHGEITKIRGIDIDSYHDKADKFLRVMAKVVEDIIDKRINFKNDNLN